MSGVAGPCACPQPPHVPAKEHLAKLRAAFEACGGAYVWLGVMIERQGGHLE